MRLAASTERGVPFVELHRLEEALLAEPSVLECAVLERPVPGSGCEVVAYVVPVGAPEPERWRAVLRAGLADPESTPRPASLVTVAPLPRTPDGVVDRAALAALPVLDGDLARTAEEALLGVPGVAGALAVVADAAEPPGALHLAELLTNWRRGDRLATPVVPEPAPAADLPEPGPAAPRPEAPPSIADGGPAVDTGEIRRLGDCLERAARASAEGVVHRGPDGSELSQTYAELLERAERLLASLRELGCRPGHRVLLQLPATEDFLPAFWGAVLGGFVPVPLAFAAGEASQRAAGALFHAWSMSERSIVVAPRDAAAEIGRLGERSGAAYRIAAIEDCSACPPDHDHHRGGRDDPAVLLLTSGSTGEPKGVLLSHGNVLSSAAGSIRVNGFTGRDVSLNWLPLNHVGALMRTVRETCLGARQVQAPAAAVLADPLCWLDWMDRDRATTSWAPNFAFGLVVEREARVRAGRWDLSSMRSLWNGGEPIAPGTMIRFLDLLAPHGLAGTAMHTAWGMTEACFATFSHRYLLDVRAGGRRVPESGRPIPGLSLRVVDAADHVVPEGAAGALQIRGAVCTMGYVQAQVDAQSFTADGWLRTGDLATLCDGRLTIIGREKDVIILCGVNYSPREIESAVEEAGGVEASFTAAFPVREPGCDTDRLAVLFHPRRAAGEEDLKALLAEVRVRLAREVGVTADYLVPVGREAIPKTAVGKIQRTVLRRRFEAGELEPAVRAAEVLAGGANTVPDGFYRRVWRRRDAEPGAWGEGATLVVLDPLGLGARLAAELAAAGRACVTAEAGSGFERLGPGRFRVDAADPEHWRRLLVAAGAPVRRAVHLGAYGAGEAERGPAGLLGLARALAEAGGVAAPVRLLAIAGRVEEPAPDAPPPPVAGLVRALRGERPGLDARLVELPVGAIADDAARLLGELAARGGDREVAWRGGARRVSGIERLDLARQPARPLPFRPGGLYLLSGGLGRAGRVIARFLLETFHARLLLVDRTPLDGEERRGAFQAFAGLPGEVLYEVAGDGDEAGVRRALERAEARWRCELDGVLHLAGAAAGHARLLHELAGERPEACFVGFASAAAFLGHPAGTGDAMAGAVLEALADRRARRGLDRTHCLFWSPWRAPGEDGDPALPGLVALSPEQALGSFLAALERGPQAMLVGLDGASPLVRHLAAAEPRPLQRLRALVTVDGEGPDPERLRAVAVSDRFGTPAGCRVERVAELPRAGAGEPRHDTGAAGAAASPAERQIAAAFAEVLGLGAVGPGDNFFALGGTSVQIARVIARLAGLFPAHPPTAVDLLRQPTARDLAGHLSGAVREAGVAVGRERAGARRARRLDAADRRAARSGGSPE